MSSEKQPELAGILAELVELTGLLESAVSTSDWEQAGDIELKRRLVAETCFASLEPGNQELEVLRNVSMRSELLLARVRDEMQAAAKSAQVVRDGRRAVDDYADVLIRGLG